MSEKYKKHEVKSGRIGGIYYGGEDTRKPMLVIFNQWRSNSHSLFSKYLAQQVLDGDSYGTVLLIDRIASGGLSDENITVEERKKMKEQGEFQFGKLYAEAIEKIRKKHALPDKYVIGGSSAGAPAAVATASEVSEAEKSHVIRIVPVEPSGMIENGRGKRGTGAVPIGFAKHLSAYRHRVKRGWWTPMNQEQYFGRSGKMFEYRAIWWARSFVFQKLCSQLADPKLPPITLVLSATSHAHTHADRSKLKECAVKPHEVMMITGNHDKICQPPSLCEIYSDVVMHKAA